MMAEWQVEFHVVPRQALSATPRLIGAAALEAQWWTGRPFPADYRERLATEAPLAESPEAGIERWGTEDGNRVDVHSEGGRVGHVSARVDVRRLDPRFGAALLVFVRAASAVLVRADGFVVEPTINAFSGALRSSAAWRYANDTATFLQNRAAVEEDAE
jgi:hypothetical protein